MTINGKIIAILPVLGLCLLQATGCASSKDAAQNHLDDVRKLNVPSKTTDDEAFVKDIGFKSIEDVDNAQLGPPLRIYKVPLDELQKFQSGDNPDHLLVNTGRVLFPVTVNEHYLSSLTVTESSITMSKGWKGARVTGTGFPRLIRKIEQLKPSSSSFLVLITPLRLSLLGDHKEGRLVLAAIEENPHFELNAGEEHDAAELFGKLAQDAKKVHQTDQSIRRKIPDMAIPESPNTEMLPRY